MATERWDDERLDRLAEIAESNTRATQASNERLDNLEKIVESNARAIQASNERLGNLENIVESNARVIQSIADALGEAAEERQEFRQSIRGLQYENRQILDILLNRQNEEDNPDVS